MNDEIVASATLFVARAHLPIPGNTIAIVAIVATITPSGPRCFSFGT